MLFCCSCQKHNILHLDKKKRRPNFFTPAINNSTPITTDQWETTNWVASSEQIDWCVRSCVNCQFCIVLAIWIASANIKCSQFIFNIFFCVSLIANFINFMSFNWICCHDKAWWFNFISMRYIVKKYGISMLDKFGTQFNIKDTREMKWVSMIFFFYQINREKKNALLSVGFSMQFAWSMLIENDDPWVLLCQPNKLQQINV